MAFRVQTYALELDPAADRLRAAAVAAALDAGVVHGGARRDVARRHARDRRAGAGHAAAGSAAAGLDERRPAGPRTADSRTLRHAPQDPRHPRPARTPTARCTSGTSSRRCRPISGCASRRCAATTACYCCAEDAHGTPIMIRAQQEGITPEALIARSAAGAPARSTTGFLIDFDQFHSTALEREPAPDARSSTRRCATRGYMRRRAVRQAYDEQAGMFLPDRYVRGTCPRCKSPDQYGDSCEVCGSTYTPGRSDRSGLHRERHHAGVARLRAPVLQARRLRAPCCASTSPAAACSRRCAPSSPSGSRPDCRTGTSRATRRTSASRCRMRPGKYFYVWFDAPIGYIASFEAWRAAHARLASTTTGSRKPRSRAVSLHRQGHQLLSHAVLAGGAAWRRTAPPDGGVRARLSDHQRPEDVQVARHLHHRAALSRAPAAGAAALLLRRQARQRHRGHRLQPRGFRGAHQLRPGRQAGQYRQPLRGFHRARRRPARGGAARARRCTREFAAAAERIAALYESREYAAAMREIMELADRANRYIDQHKPWALAKDAGARRRGARHRHAGARICFAC